MSDLSATYSPDDNKLRLFSVTRLDSATYARVKAAGFRWAPKQEQFIAPAWTPEREDLLLELCGTIDDEDSTLMDRAEDRAERFEGYQEKRARDADAAHASVRHILDGRPAGQPILIGHHSQRRAERDQERIENAMSRAVRLFETSEYWQRRAAAAVEHARYKERPDVRQRRIRSLEAEQRKHTRSLAADRPLLKTWQREGLTHEQALMLANLGYLSHCFPLAAYPRPAGASPYEGPMSLWSALRDGIATTEQAVEIATGILSRSIAHAERWLAHLENRLAYERAMLAAGAELPSQAVKPEKGGACRCWVGSEWVYIQTVNRISVTVLRSFQRGGRTFRQTVPFDKLQALMSAADVDAARAAGRLAETENKTGFFLLDHAGPGQSTTAAPAAPKPESPAAPAAGATAESIAVIRQQLREGITVATAPTLYPTPLPLARRMVELARPQPGETIREPSAGTGHLLIALFEAFPVPPADVSAVELNQTLAEGLARRFAGVEVKAADFLALDLPPVDCVLMNPPFDRAADIAHIERAFGQLRPGGRLVAICAAGPRQRDRLGALAERCGGFWEDLPPDTFASAGTNVRTALLYLQA